MSTPQYYALIPLANDTDLSTETLQSRLADRLPDYAVTEEGSLVTVTRDGWSLNLYLCDEDWVAVEAKEFAEMHPEWPNVEKLRESSSRVELASVGEDFAMDHFNTYLYVLDVVDTFRGVLFKFDPRDGQLI